MTRHGLVLVAASILCLPESALAQTNTAALAGVVIESDGGGQPVTGAQVVLTGAPLAVTLAITTGADGRFRFDALPPGRFTLTASKPAYLTVIFGQTEPGRGSGVPIALGEGQTRPDLTLALSRGAVIAGRVTDDAGQPVPNSPVMVLESRTIDGARVLQSAFAGWVMTDATGAYRASGVRPGTYLICANQPGFYQGLGTNCSSPGESARQTTAAEVQWALGLLGTSGGGVAPGRSTPAAGPPPGPQVALASVFHPGTRDVAAATPVTVTRGEERLGVDLVMPLTSTASIEGRVIDAAGRPATGVIVSFSDGFGTSSRNAADGTFSVRNLLSGRYVVSAREGTTAWATAEVALGRSDIRDLTLTLQPTLTIRGRAVIDAMSTPGAPPDLLTLRQLPQGSGLPPRSPIGPDGTFQIGGIAPGRFMWAVSSSTSAGAPPWIIKSAMVRGRDVADLPFEIGPGSALADVAITLSNLTGEVVGTLRDGSGLPIAGYSVLVFAADTTYWTARSPRLPAPVRTATDGTYRVPGLPDGQYYLAAFTELEAREIGETFLSSAAASSLRVSITAGERTVQDIVLGAPAHAPR